MSRFTISKKEFNRLTFRLNRFADVLLGEGNYYKGVIAELRKKYKKECGEKTEKVKR